MMNTSDWIHILLIFFLWSSHPKSGLLVHCLSLSSSTLYDNCEKAVDSTETIKYGCVVAAPKGVNGLACIKKKNCRHVLTFNRPEGKNSKFTEFRLMGHNDVKNRRNAYIAMGISYGIIMGDDLVVSCSRLQTGSRLIIDLSYNAKDYKNAPAFAEQRRRLVNHSIVVEDGRIICHFSLPSVTTVTDHVFNFDRDSYVVLFASGPTWDNGQIKIHALQDSFYTDNHTKIDFNVPGQYLAERPQYILLTKIHIALMTFVFISLTPTCMLIARYFKESKLKCRLFHRRIWFALHVLGLTLGLLLVLVAGTLKLVTLLTRDKKKSGLQFKDKVHLYLGLVVISSYAGQAGMGTYLALTEDRRGICRLVLSAIHWLFGSLTYALGMIQIFLSPLTEGKFMIYCSEASVMTLAWVIFHIIIYVILTICQHRMDRKGKNLPVESAKEVKTNGEQQNLLQNHFNSDPAGSGQNEEEEEEKLQRPNDKIIEQAVVVEDNNSVGPIKLNNVDSTSKISTTKKGVKRFKSKVSSKSTMGGDPPKEIRTLTSMSTPSASSMMTKREESKTTISTGKSNNSVPKKQRKKKRKITIDTNFDEKQPQPQQPLDIHDGKILIEKPEEKEEGGRGGIMIIAQSKNQPISMYDKFPDYQMTAMSHHFHDDPLSQHRSSIVTYHSHRNVMRDPWRAFRRYPMTVESNVESKNTALYELVIIIFFFLSIVMTIFHCLYLFPRSISGCCEEEGGYNHEWMTFRVTNRTSVCRNPPEESVV